MTRACWCWCSGRAAGGGLELKAFADAQPGWIFDGVDPSPEMLELAMDTVGEHASRVALHEGDVDVGPDGPSDAAVCLPTMHFMPLCERRHALRAIRQRLHRGAPFVVAHMSFAQEEDERALWLARDEAYAIAAGAPPSPAVRRVFCRARVQMSDLTPRVGSYAARLF